MAIRVKKKGKSKMGNVISMSNKILDERQVRWVIFIDPTRQEVMQINSSKDEKEYCVIFCTMDFDRIPEIKKNALEKLEQILKEKSIIL